jgi:hypothetical protein
VIGHFIHHSKKKKNGKLWAKLKTTQRMTLFR